MTLKTVRVPGEVTPIFAQAEELVGRYFRDRRDDPERGTIEICGERYVLVRAASLSVEFFSLVAQLYGESRAEEAEEFARNTLFDLAHAVGKADARAFHAKMALEDPIARLSAGPIHFAHAGWAFVDILPESTPVPTPEFCLVYDHPYSFESDAWLRAEQPRTFPACIMNAGYSSGWCEESFNLKLVASEILCRAKGDDRCRFVMAQPERIEAYVERYLARHPELAALVRGYQVPDFFARKRIEEELRRGREAERRRADLLAEVDRAKTAFFNNVSHEFRTPLTLLLGPVEDMLTHADPPLPRAQRDRLEIVRRNGMRLLKLVNSLLDYARLEAGRVQGSFERTDLPRLTSELVNVFESAIARAGLRLEIDCPPIDAPLYIDREQWEKVVFNLLSNAIKYTFEGAIAVSMRQVGDRVEMAVRDTGVGIPPDQLAHLFERFHRVRGARARTHEGTGIGLALVHELARLHGGNVRVESAVDVGTTFTVSIPVGCAHLPPERVTAAPTPHPPSPEAGLAFVEEALRWLPPPDEPAAFAPGGTTALAGASPAPAVPVERTPRERARILLADDNGDMRRYVKRLLGDRWDVDAVGDGATALARARATMPDLIISDVMMPGLDGYQLVRDLRNDRRTRTIPVLLLSARAGEDSAIGGLATGADDYLAKPFSARELVARVSTHLELARVRTEVTRRERQRAEQLQGLSEAALAINSTLSADAILRTITERARALVGARRCVTDAAIGPAPSERFVDELPGAAPGALLDAGAAATLLARAASMRLGRAELAEHPSFHPGRSPTRAWLAAALTSRDGRRLGVIQVADKLDGEFTPEDEAILVQLAQMASVALENARLYREVQDADRRKDEFLAMLGHELRNPLSAISNAVQLLGLRAQGDPTTTRTKERLERQVRTMARLLDDLLDLSRIMRGKVQLQREQVDLRGLVERAVETTRHLVDARRHELVVEQPAEPLYLSADTTRIEQVLANLLHNAAKYTEPAGRIRLVVEGTAHELLVRVLDSGIGIPSELLPRVFEPFMQGDRSLDRAQGGLGIGLTLARSLIEMHGGVIGAHSEGPGAGSEFVVRLPRAVASATPGEPAPTAIVPPPARPLRVLVVDDQVDVAETLAELVQLMGHEVRSAADGHAAVAEASTYQPDVVLLDIGLPGMDGFEVARRLRAVVSGAASRPLLVALTGYGQEADRRRAHEAGFDHHLVKPIAPAALQELLAAQLGWCDAAAVGGSVADPGTGEEEPA